MTSFDSGGVETLAYCGWSLLVCSAPPVAPSRSQLTNNNPLLISSWEFLTTLDYEWSVIRKHRAYRWTIWVRISSLFLAQIRALD